MHQCRRSPQARYRPEALSIVARPEKPISRDHGPLSEFALGLRELRQQAGGISYRELSRRTHFSASVLSEAASGNRLPSLQVTKAFVEACQGDTDAWEKRWNDTQKSNSLPRSVADWQRIYIERARHLSQDSRLTVDPHSTTLKATGDSVLPERPNPQAISTTAQLVEAMNRLHIWYGKPALRKLASKRGAFAASTLSEALRHGERLPSYRLVVAFAEACGESSDLIEEWKNAWRRIVFGERDSHLGSEY